MGGVTPFRLAKLQAWGVFFVMMFALGGCQATADQGDSDAVYLGLVRVRSAIGTDTSRRVQSLGVWLDEGVGAGWRDNRRVAISKDCQVVFLIKSWADFERARAWVQSQDKAEGRLCVALEDGPF